MNDDPKDMTIYQNRSAAATSFSYISPSVYSLYQASFKFITSCPTQKGMFTNLIILGFLPCTVFSESLEQPSESWHSRSASYSSLCSYHGLGAENTSVEKHGTNCPRWKTNKLRPRRTTV